MHIVTQKKKNMTVNGAPLRRLRLGRVLRVSESEQKARKKLSLSAWSP